MYKIVQIKKTADNKCISATNAMEIMELSDRNEYIIFHGNNVHKVAISDNANFQYVRMMNETKTMYNCKNFVYACDNVKVVHDFGTWKQLELVLSEKESEMEGYLVFVEVTNVVKTSGNIINDDSRGNMVVLLDNKNGEYIRVSTQCSVVVIDGKLMSEVC